jgi:hypothetical protein
VLNRIERRRIAEQPAGEDLVPRQLFLRAGALFHEKLHECAGFGRIFPRRGLLARGQFDDSIADAT